MTLKSLLGGAAIAALAGLALTANAGSVAAAEQSTTPPATQGQQPDQMNSGQTNPSATDQTKNQMDSPAYQNGPSNAGQKSADAMPLRSVSNPESALANAVIEDSSGAKVGQVIQVITGKNGRTTKVYASVNGKTVEISASKLKFDQSQNILLTSMTSDQIAKLPKAKGT